MGSRFLPEEVVAHLLSYVDDDGALFALRCVGRPWKQAAQTILQEQATKRLPRQCPFAFAGGTGIRYSSLTKGSLELEYYNGSTVRTTTKADLVNQAISNAKSAGKWIALFGNEERRARAELFSTGRFRAHYESRCIRDEPCARIDISVDDCWGQPPPPDVDRKSPVAEWLSMISCCDSVTAEDYAPQEHTVFRRPIYRKAPVVEWLTLMGSCCDEVADEDCAPQEYRAFRRTALLLLYTLLDGNGISAFTTQCDYGEYGGWGIADVEIRSLTLESSVGHRLQMTRRKKTTTRYY